MNTIRGWLLIDMGGALMSSLAIALILASGILPTGLPGWILYAMSLIAASFACFDFAAYKLVPENTWPLAAIGLLNLLYCAATIGVCVIYYGQLSHLGMVYFALECCIVAALAGWELFVAKRTATE